MVPPAALGCRLGREATPSPSGPLQHRLRPRDAPVHRLIPEPGEGLDHEVHQGCGRLLRGCHQSGHLAPMPPQTLGDLATCGGQGLRELVMDHQARRVVLCEEGAASSSQHVRVQGHCGRPVATAQSLHATHLRQKARALVGQGYRALSPKQPLHHGGRGAGQAVIRQDLGVRLHTSLCWGERGQCSNEESGPGVAWGRVGLIEWCNVPAHQSGWWTGLVPVAPQATHTHTAKPALRRHLEACGQVLVLQPRLRPEAKIKGVQYQAVPQCELRAKCVPEVHPRVPGGGAHQSGCVGGSDGSCYRRDGCSVMEKGGRWAWWPAAVQHSLCNTGTAQTPMLSQDKAASAHHASHLSSHGGRVSACRCVTPATHLAC